jgi:flavin reductase (DIM6/NTAB) family NADH-FMN oxidoreductase RutF
MASEGVQSRMTVSNDEFRRVCGRFATGVAIASAVGPDGVPHGLTISSFTSVSLQPPLILICLGHAVTNIAEFRQATHFGISILGEARRSLSDRFAQKGHDRFDGVEWFSGETGVPLIAGALGTMECSTYQRIPCGDHDIFVGEVVRASVTEGKPLIYFGSGYRGLTG